VVSVVMNHLSPGLFLGRIKTWVDPADIIGGMIKGAVFGFLIAIIACYRGFNAAGGSKGVGIATNKAVVAGSVVVLVIDYFLSILLQPFWSSR
jgi:phospholipid/cholesterol/gamma-HCH transport system permease protein